MTGRDGSARLAVRPSSRLPERGFSLVEVLVALVILAAGVLALAGGSMVVTRDLVRSRQTTRASAALVAKLDALRALAAATVPACQAPGFASSSTAETDEGVTLTWTVPASGTARTVGVVARYTVAAGRIRSDTLYGVIPC